MVRAAQSRHERHAFVNKGRPLCRTVQQQLQGPAAVTGREGDHRCCCTKYWLDLSSLVTFPNTTCLPSNQEVTTVHRKNCAKRTGGVQKWVGGGLEVQQNGVGWVEGLSPSLPLSGQRGGRCQRQGSNFDPTQFLGDVTFS